MDFIKANLSSIIKILDFIFGIVRYGLGIDTM